MRLPASAYGGMARRHLWLGIWSSSPPVAVVAVAESLKQKHQQQHQQQQQQQQMDGVAALQLLMVASVRLLHHHLHQGPQQTLPWRHRSAPMMVLVPLMLQGLTTTIIMSWTGCVQVLGLQPPAHHALLSVEQPCMW